MLPSTHRTAAIAATISGALAVILGAFGAHALRDHVDAAALQIWHTAVEYQFWHTLALLASAAAPASRCRTASTLAFLAGIVLFCGSLYALALGAPRFVGAITPFGGATFIAGWISLGIAFWRTAK
jgi:uncharacterized membrane protein YgdD (TMEM256/DUF423 family)